MYCRIVYCIITYRNSDVKIEYFLEEYSLLSSKAIPKSHQIISNPTCENALSGKEFGIDKVEANVLNKLTIIVNC